LGSGNFASFDHDKRFSSLVEISWNKERPSDVEAARRKFDEYTRQGWLAFIISPKNSKVQVYEFDPALEKIFLVPLAEGG
jgi:hypothetical protein